ncbi:MAG: hypothetical protein Q8O87_00065 [bacterium]|nr:hypothetical protein [bacterium]
MDIAAILKIIIQIAAATTGAAALWGLYFHIRNIGAGNDSSRLINLCFLVLASSVAIFLVAWLLNYSVFSPNIVTSHEGIVTQPTQGHINSGSQINLWMLWPLIIVSLFSIFSYSHRPRLYQKYIGWSFLAHFLIISAIMIFSVYKGGWDKEQLFFALHSWHSILTIGTVILIDLLYSFTSKDVGLKKILYQAFHKMSMAIWIGLGLDFASAFLVYPEALVLNAKFYFIQTVIAIIIINGALLSGRVSNWLLGTLTGQALSRQSKIIIGLSGSISIISWLTITAIDSLEIGWAYWQFALAYLIAIVAAYLFHKNFMVKDLEKQPKLG